jgi:aminoglycoside phosphotransferase (APT) family kinase protein
MHDHLDEDLAAVVAAAFGAGVTISGLRQLSGGASRETWSFDVVRPDGARDRLILRRDPPGSPKAGMSVEASLLRAARQAGVPVPHVVTADDDPGVLGSPFIVMEHVDGETIPRRILRDEAFAAARPLLAAQCGRILAAVHAIPAAQVPGLAEGDPVEEWRTNLDALGEPHPAFELGLRWLDEHRPRPRAASVVHGDFRNGNLIVGPDGVRSVLDWELAHLGDPLEDLGWLCVRAWRFGVDRPVGGFGEYDELIGAYEGAAGTEVDRDALRWWEIMGTLKWGVMCIMQAWTHTSGFVRSVELAAIGRRVCENEYDLMNLLPSPWDGRAR